jgi:Tfp pilus assembly protein PilP
MKKLFPAVLYVLAVVVVVGVAIAGYKMFFGGTAVKEGSLISSQDVSPSNRKIPAGKPETKKPGLLPAGPARIETEKPAIAYEYDAKGRRDPFATLIVKKETEGRRKGATPLESYEVSEFVVRGIFWDKSAFYALVSAPDGKNYSVNEGTRIGLNHGTAYRITKTSVVVTESVKDYRGIARPKRTVLKLHREE